MPRALALPTAGQFQHVAGMLSRETARREQAVEQLHQTEASFRLLVDGVTDCALYMLDPRGCVTSWNPGAARIKGYTAEEIVGQHFSRFYTAQDQDASIPAKALETAGNTGRYEAEGWRVAKGGRQFWASVVIHPLFDNAQQIIGFAKITRDITERRQAEEALEQARAQLVQSQKMEAVGQLTGGVAHDFNNLLTAILGSLELLEHQNQLLPVEAERLLAVMRRAAERGATLTTRLLAFSRRQTLAPRLTDLNRLVANMSELLRRTLGVQTNVETVLAGGLWATMVDPHQLESSILNLALNARDAMPQGGKLTIETGNTYLDRLRAGARQGHCRPVCAGRGQ